MLLHQLAVENKDIFGLMMSMMNETKITLEVDDGNDPCKQETDIYNNHTENFTSRSDAESQILNICFTTFQRRTVIPICEIYRNGGRSYILDINDSSTTLGHSQFIKNLQQISRNLHNECTVGFNNLIEFKKDRVILNKTRMSANSKEQAQIRELIGEISEILAQEFSEKD